MNKPDWKDAPEWANWVAMDSDGVWKWCESKPNPLNIHSGGGIWDITSGRWRKATRMKKLIWDETLQERPK